MSKLKKRADALIEFLEYERQDAECVREMLEYIDELEAERRAVVSGSAIMTELRFKTRSVADGVADFSARVAAIEPSQEMVSVVKNWMLDQIEVVSA